MNQEQKILSESEVAKTELFRIKPLEWKWFDNERKRGYRARITGFADRYVYQEYGNWGCPECSHRGASWDSSWFVDHVNTLTRTGCTSPKEGKQLAEAHWREYIKQALVATESCIWKYDPNGYWKTGCGEGFTLSNEESLSANAMRFCHACGKRIEEQALIPVETSQ